MIAGAERLGQAIFGKRREKAASEVEELPEMWRFWQETKALVESRDAEPDGSHAASAGGEEAKRQAA